MLNEKDINALLDSYQNRALKDEPCKLENLKTCPIVLYGAGNVGEKLYQCFKDNDIKVVAFLDQNTNIDVSKFQIPVYHPASEEAKALKENYNVILSALFSLNICNSIKKQLIELGFKQVFALHEIRMNTIDCDEFYKTLFIGSYHVSNILGKDREKVIEAFSLLETNQERSFYLQYIKAYLTKNFTGFDEPHDSSLQYLAHDIPVEKKYNNFIDCGGFDGDTLRNLIAHEAEIKNYAVFEPQNHLCEKITKYIQQGEKTFDSALIFPCGVHSKISKLKFSSAKKSLSSAKIDSAGDDIIQCVAIDDIMQGFAPTFIKMDIEGAEVEALKGARKTIMKYRPQLAICVYHSLSDIWEIPLLIKSFYSGYKFYLRNYQFMGLETVIYAFPE